MIEVTGDAFVSIQEVDTQKLSRLSERELRPLLPCLVRMALCRPLDESGQWSRKRKEILRILAGIEVINSLVLLLSIDFHALDVDIKKEQMIRQKLGNGKVTDSILVQSLENGLAIEFEQSDAPRKLRLVLSEILDVIYQVQNLLAEAKPACKSSELFDNPIYFDEVADVLCIAQAEISSLLSLPSVAEALLSFKYGPELICHLVANSPDSFTEVYVSFILNGPKHEEDNENDHRRVKVLKMLCKLNPLQALTVRAFAVEHCRMPGLCVSLTLDLAKQENLVTYGISDKFSNEVGNDLVGFVSGLLLGSDSKVRLWFSNFVRTTQKKMDGTGHTMKALREELLKLLENVAPKSNEGIDMQENKVIQASILLKLYCAFKGIGGLKFNDKEVKMLLSVIISHPPPTPAGIHFLSIGLCLLIACPSLISDPDQEKKAITWIRWLIQEGPNFESQSGVSASFAEMLLLLAIHFHGDQITAITDLICSTLGMKIAIRANNLNRIKTIFTHDIFTEKVVASHAVRVPVTPNLSSNIQGFLPVHCIYQLLKSRTFSKYQVPIKAWIYNQICNAVAPLHQILPLLIEVYVTSIIVPNSSNKALSGRTNKPIEDDEICAVFHDSSFKDKTILKKPCKSNSSHEKPTSSLTSQLLMLYYLMLYEDVRLMNVKNIISCGYSIKSYSDQLLSQLPIKYLLQQAQKCQQNYAGLFAPLLKLLTSHYPHLCLPQAWIYEIENDCNVIFLENENISIKSLSSKQLNEAFASIEAYPGKLIMLLDAILSLPANKMWKFANSIVSNFPCLLEDGVPREVIHKVQKIWWKLNSIMPRRLWVMTVQVLQPKSSNGRKLRQDDIVLDPLTVLRCDERVFRCPPIFEITLHMLKAFLAASSTHLSRHILNNPITPETMKATINGNSVENDNEREELKIALVAAQESAAVQILLETCLMMPEEQNQHQDSKTTLSDLREVQCLVCSHLHQVFIGEPSLAKLVHFQGYPTDLIPMAVAGIPSMHICLDFIPELLSQPQLEKQIFGIALISHLCMKYALPKSLSIARLAIQILSTLLSVLSYDKHYEVFLPTLPALVRICQAFPPLADEIITFLLQLGRISASFESLTDFNTCSKSTLESKISIMKSFHSKDPLGDSIRLTFAELCDKVALNKAIY